MNRQIKSMGLGEGPKASVLRGNSAAFLSSRHETDELSDWKAGDKLAAVARAVLEARKARSSFMPDDLFGEPAWDMLLDLYVAEKESKQISISSACIAAGGSATTALRWLSRLEKLNLVERREDKVDRRRIFVQITPRAHAVITAWLAKIIDHNGL